LQAWAAAEFLDAVIGRVLDFVASSRLASNTYIMITSDNGPQILEGETDPAAKLVGYGVYETSNSSAVSCCVLICVPHTVPQTVCLLAVILEGQCICV
jgi:arylsulfatase A-like enzyme